MNDLAFPDSTRDALEPLAWDANHFGLPVARIASPDLDDAGLEALLRRARRDGFRLVYWSTPTDRLVPTDLLSSFGGLLADRKATYVIDGPAPDRGDGRGASSLFVIDDAIGEAATPPLIALGVAAGEYSRFRRDPRIPDGRARALYEAWMARSLRGELADAVLVATTSGDARPAGMVTISVKDGAGSIGLLAVGEGFRGVGLGRALVAAAHGRMREAGATRARVVTQRENGPACALYERCGYRLDDVRNFFHLWL